MLLPTHVFSLYKFSFLSVCVNDINLIFQSLSPSSGESRDLVEPLNFEKTDFEPLNFLELLGILPHFSQF